MLVMVQACTPPLLLAGPLGRKTLEPWRGVLHSFNVVLAVMLSRFAIFDILAVGINLPAVVNYPLLVASLQSEQLNEGKPYNHMTI